jgi:hypothetical protein
MIYRYLPLLVGPLFGGLAYCFYGHIDASKISQILLSLFMGSAMTAGSWICINFVQAVRRDIFGK